jgi:hypothetical protein
MSPTDYHDALRLLNTALAVVEQRHISGRPAGLRRRLRGISLQLDLLRARLRQPPAHLQRN